jgi:hypothetical protein
VNLLVYESQGCDTALRDAQAFASGILISSEIWCPRGQSEISGNAPLRMKKSYIYIAPDTVFRGIDEDVRNTHIVVSRQSVLIVHEAKESNDLVPWAGRFPPPGRNDEIAQR